MEPVAKGPLHQAVCRLPRYPFMEPSSCGSSLKVRYSSHKVLVILPVVVLMLFSCYSWSRELWAGPHPATQVSLYPTTSTYYSTYIGLLLVVYQDMWCSSSGVAMRVNNLWMDVSSCDHE
jgi:hypothetical protein